MASRVSAFVTKHQGPLFNIFLSFMCFNCAGQVYQGKLQRVGLEADLVVKTNALAKMERAVADQSRSGADLRRDISRLIAEAKGVAEAHAAAELAEQLEREAALAPAQDASKKLVL